MHRQNHNRIPSIWSVFFAANPFRYSTCIIKKRPCPQTETKAQTPAVPLPFRAMRGTRVRCNGHTRRGLLTAQGRGVRSAAHRGSSPGPPRRPRTMRAALWEEVCRLLVLLKACLELLPRPRRGRSCDVVLRPPHGGAGALYIIGAMGICQPFSAEKLHKKRRQLSAARCRRPGTGRTRRRCRSGR